jgi:hypothetical protein
VVCATLILPECNPTRPVGHSELIQIKRAILTAPSSRQWPVTPDADTFWQHALIDFGRLGNGAD